MTHPTIGSVAMGDSRERGAARATVKDHIAWAVQIMQRGARMRLDGIPDDPTFLSSSFGPDVTAEIARTLTAALARPVQEPVTVKPLEWIGNESRSSLGDLYSVQQLSPNVWTTYMNGTAFPGWKAVRSSAMAVAQENDTRRAAPQPAHGTSATDRAAPSQSATDAVQTCLDIAADYWKSAGDTIVDFDRPTAEERGRIQAATAITANLQSFWETLSQTPTPAPNALALSEDQIAAVLHLVESRLCIIWAQVGAREAFSNELRVLEPVGDDEEELCTACDVPFEDGDLVYWNSDDTGHLHADCCGPERESYVNADGAPLKDGEPIPAPFAWRAGR